MVTMSNQIAQLARSLSNWLLDPHSRVTKPEKIQRSRLLSTILLVLVLLGVMILAIVINHDPEDFYAPEVRGALLVLGIVVLMYIFNRMGYNRYAVGGVILAFVLVFTYVAFSSSGKSIFLAFLLIPILLTAIFFSLRWTTIISISILTFILVLLSIQDRISAASAFWSLRNMLFFLLLATALLLTFIWHLGKLEKIRQQELKHINEDLEQKVAELERFTYTVSHEIKIPVVTIKNFLGSIEKDLQNEKYDRAKKDMLRVSTASDKLLETISDLLQLSRVGRITNRPEEVDLVKLTQEVLESLDARINSKNVSVRISPDLPIVYGDRIRLREVMENLIDNAAKYAGDQSKPLIEVGIKKQSGESIIFVKDHGIGIDPQYHSRIFSLFEKLNPASEGTGIGLAIVKRIIETHGGKVWAESEGLGKGATFCFTLPNGVRE